MKRLLLILAFVPTLLFGQSNLSRKIAAKDSLHRGLTPNEFSNAHKLAVEVTLPATATTANQALTQSAATTTTTTNKNLLDITQVVSGSAISTSTGLPVGFAGFSMSPSISVAPGQVLTLSGLSYNSHGVSFFSSGGSLVSFTTVYIFPYTFTVPAGAASLRFTVKHTFDLGDPTNVMLELGGTKSQTVPASNATYANTIGAKSMQAASLAQGAMMGGYIVATQTPNTIIEGGINLFNINTISVDSAVNTSTGAIGSFANFTISAKIPVQSGALYTLQGLQTGINFCVTFLSVSGSVVTSPVCSTAFPLTFIPPVNTASVRFTTRSNSQATTSRIIKLEKGAYASLYTGYNTGLSMVNDAPATYALGINAIRERFTRSPQPDPLLDLRAWKTYYLDGSTAPISVSVTNTISPVSLTADAFATSYQYQPDGYVSATLTNVPDNTASEQHAGIIIRAAKSNQYLSFVVFNKRSASSITGRGVALVSSVQGQSDVWSSVTALSGNEVMEAGDVILAVETKGNSLTCSVNGKPVITTTLSNTAIAALSPYQAPGLVGVRFSSSTTMRVSDFSVTNYRYDRIPMALKLVSAYGSSRTAGIGATTVQNQWAFALQGLLTSNLGRSVTVLNGGLPGQTSSVMSATLAGSLTSQGVPDIVLLEVDINDAKTDGNGISIAQTRDNYRTMIQQCKAVGAIPILWTSFPMNQASFSQFSYSKAAEANAIARKIAQEEGIRLIDFEKLFGMDNSITYLVDGLHANDRLHAYQAQTFLGELLNP